MFRLSEDLRQYFTSDADFKIDNASAEYMLATLIGYQENSEEYIQCIEDFEDEFEDLLMDDITDVTTLDIHLFMDFFNDDLYEALFRSFLKSDDFEIIETDSTLEYLYDYNHEGFIDVTERYPRKLKKEIDYYYQDAIKEVADSEYGLDEYIASMIAFKCRYLKIKNKGIARKLRKNYAQKGWFYDLMNAFDFYMINGEFIFILVEYLEGGGYMNNVEPVTVINSIVNLNKMIYNREFNEIAVDMINNAVAKTYDANSIIALIDNLLCTEKEVII